MPPHPAADVTIRTDLRPGDLGTLVERHGTLYARELGFDVTFEAYVAAPLARFALERTDRERLWIAERPEGPAAFAGCIAIVATADPREAQLRWFLVDPSARGLGLGKRLLDAAVAFARASGYESIHLWTVSALPAAARLYRAAGFAKVEEKKGAWGVPVVEERHVLSLAGAR